MSKSASASVAGAERTSDGAAAGACREHNTQELTGFVQNLLQNMQERFQEMSDSIITRIDEMGTRIDDLENSISELMHQAGLEEGDTQATKASVASRNKS
ncbi:heat shock factor binding protein 1 [Trypanosoma rangeli]|uniref:Heat shock factor binding protein 1 n=1 Tax=Trypanosoma rangeli TaxID=5698 RepID=A0A422P2Q0_TRYRA|nr:heat shock factor binding protein 1 [Trypanosoma rangeli]RNF11998.1 heat shock factor binding protein 1 [Trypanosoma rangeli]|eukprot:RNF11998.1 heat shock factor binding protein 1 [Trypanosoma rangeli]